MDDELLTLQRSCGRFAEGQTGVAAAMSGCQGWPAHTGLTLDQLHQATGSHRSVSTDTHLSQL